MSGDATIACDRTKRLDALVVRLRSRTYDVTDEARVQLAIAHTLSAAELPFSREVRLDDRSRIDFIVDDEGAEIGIEVKVDGSATSILRQCARYIAHARINALIVATTRARHVRELRNSLPQLDARVPCDVVLLRGAL